jgi:hypothetical protein
MKDYIKQIADGRLTRGEVIERLKGWSKDSVKDFLDDMVADAIMILMDGGNTPANQVKSNRLSDMVDSIATELLPGYDKLRKPTQTASGNNQLPTEMEEKFASQELQEVKQEFVKVGLIVDGRLDVGTADCECLVKTFSDVFGIKTKKGDLARKACAVFMGFTGNLESARSSTHNEQQSPKANLIKAICKEIHTKYVK